MISSRAVGAGAFLLVGGLLFTIALFMIGERRMMFKDRFEVYSEFAKLGQLEVGAAVRVSGMDAGEVTQIQIPPSPAGKFRVKMEIREALHGLVRTDSVASVQTEGLVGSIYLSIGDGTQAAPEVMVGGTIAGREPFTFADLLQQTSDTVEMVSQTVESLTGDVEKALQEIALTAEDAHGLFEDLRPDALAMARHGNKIAADVSQVIADINAGKGTIGKFVHDPDLYNRAKEIAEEAKAVMTNVREVTAETKRAVADFRSKGGPAQGLMSEMRGTIGQAREAVADLADNMEALKHNFFFKGFFNRRGYFDLDSISPTEYRSGALEGDKRKALRTWLASRVLFDVLPDGTEALSEDGKARLDSAMATYLRYLPANPLVVEGYATDGSGSEQYRRARQRAGTVREYLLGRYSLSPQATGYISLASDAPGSPEGNTWDGVAITLFADPAALDATAQKARVSEPLRAVGAEPLAQAAP